MDFVERFLGQVMICFDCARVSGHAKYAVRVGISRWRVSSLGTPFKDSHEIDIAHLEPRTPLSLSY
jgi:hypothetical protein